MAGATVSCATAPRIASHGPEATARNMRENASIEDERLRAATVRAVAAEGEALARHVSVSVRDGATILEGQVSSLVLRQRAEDAASSVEGAGQVRNELTVPIEKPRGTALQRAIKDALAADPATSREIINVYVRRRPHRLTGYVSTEPIRRRAEEIARVVSGEGHIDNELISARGAAADDDALVAAVRAQLAQSESAAVRALVVSADGGRVELRGSAARPEERREAIRRAFRGGATAVGAAELRVASGLPDPRPYADRRGRRHLQ
jgi:osmotically-inducible protein OsmY